MSESFGFLNPLILIGYMYIDSYGMGLWGGDIKGRKPLKGFETLSRPKETLSEYN